MELLSPGVQKRLIHASRTGYGAQARMLGPPVTMPFMAAFRAMYSEAVLGRTSPVQLHFPSCKKKPLYWHCAFLDLCLHDTARRHSFDAQATSGPHLHHPDTIAIVTLTVCV